MNRDEEQALKLLQDHNLIMKDSIENFKGRIVEIIGDAFLAAFESATDCLNCCIQIQEKFKDYNSEKSKHEKIKVRIGVHVGDVIEFEGKLKGDALNIAARIQQIAEPGTIYASENFYLTVKGKTETKFRKEMEEITYTYNHCSGNHCYCFETSCATTPSDIEPISICNRSITHVF